MRLDTRGFETQADNELANAGAAQNSDVPLEQGFAAELEQTLGPVAHSREAPTHACRKHHRLHRCVAYQSRQRRYRGDVIADASFVGTRARKVDVPYTSSCDA